MGSYLVAVGIIVCISIVLMRIFKKNFSEVCLIAVGGIIFLLYFFGYINKLAWGICFLYFIALLSSITIIYDIFRKRKTYAWWKDKGLSFFLLACVLIYCITLHMRVCAGDEFTHWGTVVKSMLVTNTLGCNPQNGILFPEYLPGASIFEYLFCISKTGALCEANMYRAMDIMLLSAFLPVFSICEKNSRICNCFCGFILMAIPMFFLPKTWLILQVDSLLMILFASIMIVVGYAEEDSFKVLFLCIALGLLVLVKESGIAYAIFVLLYICIIELKKKEWSKLAIYTFSTLSIFFSWRLLLSYYEATSANVEMQTNINTGNMIAFLRGECAEWQYEVFRRFFLKFKETTMGSACPFIVFVILMCIFPVIIQKISKKHYLFKVDILINSVSFVGYSLYMLLMYVFMWGEAAGLDVVSFWRYMGTYIGAWLLYYMAQLFIHLKDMDMKKRYVLGILVVCLCLVFPIYDLDKSFVNTWKSVASNGRRLRENYSDSEIYSQKLDWKTDKVFIISQFAERTSANYLDYWITRYNIAPVKTNEFGSHSFGDTGQEKDVNNIEISIDEWEQMLINESYSYVYIYEVDEGFTQKYGELFEVSEIRRGLYSVNIEQDKVRLQYVENA